jgi:hypothetical protein
MKVLKISVFVIIIVAGILIITYQIMLHGERPKSEFSNYDEARASGLMDKGWIPTFIPKSSNNIKEQHDLDTNWVKMSFNYDISDKEDTRRACDSEHTIEGGIEFKCSYFGSKVSIKLFNDGTGELYSSPY